MSLTDKIDAEIEKLWKDDDGRGSNTVPIIVLGLERAKEIILSEQKEPCEWILEDEDSNTWECSKCGELWQIISGTPQDNNMNYCSNCGRLIQPHQDIEEVFNRR